MLAEVFYWALSMSIAAALADCAVMMIARIRRIPRRVAVWLWLAPAFRMAVPFGLVSRFGLMALLSRFTVKAVNVYSCAESIELSMMNCVMAADSYFPIVFKAKALEKVFAAAARVWIAGVLLLLLLLAASYSAALLEVRGARRARGNVYFSEKISVPAVYGVWRPKIVLPIALQGRDNRYILLHERAHIRRRDNLWRLLAALLTAAHWFNPFAWIFLKAFLSDMELSCDERVIKKLNKEQTKDYARALLNARQGGHALMSSFGGAGLRVRIENILSFKKLTWFSFAGFAALLVSVFYVLLTNAG